MLSIYIFVIICLKLVFAILAHLIHIRLLLVSENIKTKKGTSGLHQYRQTVFYNANVDCVVRLLCF